jgi:hypothetical protein
VFILSGICIKFGYHTIKPDTRFDNSVSLEEFTESYDRVNNAILKFTGERGTNVIRLNYFSGNAEIIDFLSDNGVVALLTADDERNSYALSDIQNDQLLSRDYIVHEGMRYIKTDLRFDNKKLPFSKDNGVRVLRLL